MIEEKDLTIRLGYLMDFGKESFDIEIANLRFVQLMTRNALYAERGKEKKQTSQT